MVVNICHFSTIFLIRIEEIKVQINYLLDILSTEWLPILSTIYFLLSNNVKLILMPYIYDHNW